jgi:hypothetical protein
MDAVQPDDRWAIRAGVIRITPGTHQEHDADYLTNPGLIVYANSAHIAVGLQPPVLIHRTGGWLRVQAPGAGVGAVLVTGDETAAVRRLMFGGSGGKDGVNITCSDEGGKVNLASQAGYDQVAHPSLNLWIAWLSPTLRGVGDPATADAAMVALAALEARVAALESGRVC